MPIAVLHDANRCFGCGQCAQACADAHNPGSSEILTVKSSPVPLTPTALTRVRYKDVVYNGEPLRVATKIQCMHCIEPACAAAFSIEYSPETW